VDGALGLLAKLAGHGATPALLGLVCALFVLHRLRSLGATRDATNREALARARLDAAFDALERDEASGAIEHCLDILSTSRLSQTRTDAVRLLAYAFAVRGDWSSLMAILESDLAANLPAEDLDRYQRVARDLGRREDAKCIARLRRSPASHVNGGRRGWSV
jgi:hypothetical protein